MKFKEEIRGICLEKNFKKIAFFFQDFFFFFVIKLIHRLQEIILQEVSYRANILILRSFEKN